MGEQGSRMWWPSDWIDEINPPGRDTPDGFIIAADGHYWLGYSFDATDVSHQDKRYFSEPLDAGQIVNFLCCDDLGEVDVTIMPDGTWSAAGPVPERATHFWVPFDSDTLSNSLPEFVEAWIGLGVTQQGKPDTVTVRMLWWSDPLPHKLTIDYSGGFTPRPKFERVTSEARQ